MDALTQTFDFISSLIRGSEEDGLVVWWRYEGDHAGTHVSAERRQAMVGDAEPEVTIRMTATSWHASH